MSEKPTGRGGPNRGQGRKPRKVPREAITVKLEPEDAEMWRTMAKLRGMSQADWIAERIRTARK